MKKIPLVSVIVAVYNIEDYVEDCLKTLVSQDYENLEIIVMDDGSTDKSGEICDKFASKKLRVVHRKNGGLSDARNCGALEAKGELICFVDGDDKVKKNYVSRLVEALVSSGANIAVCGFNKEQPKKRIVSGGQATMDLLIGQENIDIVFMDINMPGLTGLDTVSCINKLKPDTVIIIISAFDRFQYAQEAMNLGVYKYITKPVNRNVIIQTVRESMNIVDNKRGQVFDEAALQRKMDMFSPMIENDFMYSVIFSNEVNSFQLFRIF